MLISTFQVKEAHMTTQQGRFIWYDLATTDLAAAQRFYSAVVGWQARDAGQPGMAYVLLNPPSAAEGMGVAGMMELPKQMCDAGARPAWNGYVHVADVDAFAARVQRLGGKIHQPPADIPNVGRFSYVADPQGAGLHLFRPNGEGAAPPPDTTPGYIGWRELATSDASAAFAFYSELLGWKRAEAFDMGERGTYQVFTCGDGQRGGLMQGQPGKPAAWRYYISVAGIEPAVARLRQQGGEVLVGPMQVPDGSWVAVARDPQGAELALIGPKSG
jgi:predicted enzyme related to lactoylglutathione lyase